MKNVKQKIMLAMLCLGLILALTACGNTNSSNDTEPTDAPTVETPTVLAESDEPTEPSETEEATEEPSEEINDEPTTEEGVTDEVTEETTEEAPTAVDEPTDTASDPSEPDEEEPTAAYAEIVPEAASVGTLSGTFAMAHENVTGLTLTFAESGVFTMVLSPEGLDFDIGIDLGMLSDISINGTYAVNEAAQTVTLRIPEENIFAMVEDLLDTMLDDILLALIGSEFGDIFGDLLDDEDAIEGFLTMMMAMMDITLEDMIAEMVSEMSSEFEEMVLTFDGNFDRLYGDHDTVFVRQ